jgi:general secretion pathway protein A
VDPLMYEAFYGLRERPFELTANPRFLLLTGKHREALSNLQYGLTSRRGLTLLIGEAGTGKTTLVHATLAEFEHQGATVAYLNNPTLTREDFYEFLISAFRLDPVVAGSKTKLLGELAKRLEQLHAAGPPVGLVIDEAQALPDELLEEVRLLANMETATDKLLPIVLAGQPELADRLNRSSLRQLKQRVALRCELGALDARETGEYISVRIRIAGGNSIMLFTRQAVDRVFERSGGIPRLISVICDNALISGFAADRRPVSRDIIDEVCRDFDLLPTAAAPPKRSDAAPDQGVGVSAKPIALSSAAKVDGPFEHVVVRRRFSLF